MPEDLENKGLAQKMDLIHDHSAPQKGKPKTMQKLQNHQPHRPPCRTSATMQNIGHHAEQTQRKSRKAEEILADLQCKIDHRKTCFDKKERIHIFIDFMKAFDCFWHEGLWQVVREYNFDKDLIHVIQALYANSNGAVLLNNQLGTLFRTTV